MRTYETILILKPQLSDPEVAEFVEKAKKLISGEGGEILSEDKLGRRKLAHPIGRNRDGFYVYIKFKASSAVLDKLNHQLRVSENVMRHINFNASEKKEAAPAAPTPPVQPQTQPQARQA